MTDRSTQGQLNINADRRMDTVDDYQFEPIKGYPMLHWHGKRPFTSTRYYPAQHKETHGPEVNGWRNKIYWGDNLQVMSHLLKEFRGKVKLVYIDPPYDSKADYKMRVRLRGRYVYNDFTTFEEKQYTDLWTNDEYLQFMYERLILIRELLSTNGVVCLQCDSNRGHYLRCILDEVFGAENHINTITWQRSHAHGDTGQGAKHFGKVTEYVHMYAKGSDYIFNPQYTPYSDKIIKRDYKYIDEATGERYRLMPTDGPGGAAKGNPYYEFRGVKGYFRYSEDTMQKLWDKGEIVISSTGKSLHRKRYLKDAKGTPVTDLWNDVNRISPTSNERLGYPTQKPEELLERIINTYTNAGFLVFDCFMGSGTTQAVAMKLGRRFIGADINLGAIQITTKRLLQVAAELEKEHDPQLALDLGEEDGAEPARFYTGFEVYNVNHYDVFRNPVEAKELLIAALELNKLAPGHLFDGERDGRLWKIMPVNRIATRQDLNELVSNLDYRAFAQRQEQRPGQPVERITLVCMGHEPDLGAILKKEVEPYKIDVEVLDVLRDRQDIEFKRDSEARVVVKNGHLVIDNFYPMNLLSKLSLQKERVDEWRELVESIMIDWNYDGAILQPQVVDIPEKDELVAGRYQIPADAGTIRVKITDLLSESLEVTVAYG